MRAPADEAASRATLTVRSGTIPIAAMASPPLAEEDTWTGKLRADLRHRGLRGEPQEQTGDCGESS